MWKPPTCGNQLQFVEWCFFLSCCCPQEMAQWQDPLAFPKLETNPWVVRECVSRNKPQDQIPIHVLGMFPRVKVSESCSSATFRDTSFLGPRLMSACQRKAFVWVQYIERLSLRYSYPGLSLSLRVLLLPGVENWWTPEPQPLGFGDAVCVAGIWRYPILGSKIGCGPLESLPFFSDYYSNPFQSAGRDPFWWVVLWIDRD